MDHHVATGPGKFNLLSETHVFRVALLQGGIDGTHPRHQHVLVLEALDGSYHAEYPFWEGAAEGAELVFEFLVRDPAKPYKCYVKNTDLLIHFDELPLPMAGPHSQDEE